MSDHRSFTNIFYQMCVRGFRQMSPEAQNCLSGTVTLSQGINGLFYGQAGQEDLYYTFFGLLLAMASGAKIDRKTCEKNARSIDFTTLDFVHGCAWLRVMNILKWLTVPHCLRNLLSVFFQSTADKKNIQKLQSLLRLPNTAFPQQDVDAPYSRFLLSTMYSDFGKTLPEPNLEAYRLPNGLFANLKNHGDYGTNATAAALFLLPEEKREVSADVLWALQESDGSYKATASAPMGDLMSTATAVFALQQCRKTPRISVKPFLRDCFRENGFFAATSDAPLGALEYTTYGLLLMGVTS